MVDANVVAMKLGELTERIARVRSHCPADLEDLAADRDTLDLVAFNLLLAVQTCLDLASHLISDEGWPPVATAREPSNVWKTVESSPRRRPAPSAARSG